MEERVDENVCVDKDINESNSSCGTNESNECVAGELSNEPKAAGSSKEKVNKGEEASHFDQILFKCDIYSRIAEDRGWKSRYCFTLLQIDEAYKIFEGVTRVVDLYASPGVWTQVLSRRLFLGESVSSKDKPWLFYSERDAHQRLESQEEPIYKINEDVMILAVDSYPVPLYPGVVQIEGDITKYSTSEFILKHFHGRKVELVVCNKILTPTELHCVDVNFQANHIANVLFCTCNILLQGGTLVMAISIEIHNNLLKMQLSSLFKEVYFFKPKSAQIYTTEAFAICKHYVPPDGFDPKLMGPFLEFFNKDYSSLTGINRILIPFLVCGDVTAYPLSSEDEEMYVNKFTISSVCSGPTSCSSRTEFEDDEQNLVNYVDKYVAKMSEAFENISIENNPDLVEIQTVRNKFNKHTPSSDTDNCSSGREKIAYDDGPLHELIRQTTKIKEHIESENVVE